MTTAALIFALTYLVLGLQRIPRLHIGRPAGALLGAVAMVAAGVLTFEDAERAIDLDTILFLLGMMIVLAYLELSGFFDVVERAVLRLARNPRGLLLLVILSSGILSALFMNDTVCLMLTPVVLRSTRKRALPAAPYLIAVATGSNIGSVCTVIGNPQNALIAVRSGIPFLPFVSRLWPVSALGLALAAGVLVVLYRRQISSDPFEDRSDVAPESVSFEPWLLTASVLTGAGLVLALALGIRPPAAAMTAAAILVLAGATRPLRALQRIDWSLLLLFGGLFVVMRGVAEAGLSHALISRVVGPLEAAGPAALARFGAAVTILSQAVSNVPAVLLFLPSLQGLTAASARALWLALAAFSTLAGNLTILGSVANLIVFETGRREGVEVGFSEYLRAGIPITLLTLGIAWVVLIL